MTKNSAPSQQEDRPTEDTKPARQFRMLLESTSEGIYGIDTQGRCTFINQAAARTLGYQPEETLGRNMHHLIHHTRSDGSPFPEAECPIFRALQVTEGAQVDDGLFWRKDGTSFPVEYSSSPIIEDGSIQGAVVVFADITERKRFLEEMEHRAQQQQAVADIGLFALEGNNLPTLMNEAVHRVHETFGVDYSMVLKLLPDENCLLLLAGVGWDERLIGSKKIPMEETHAGYTIRTSKPVVVKNYLEDTRFKPSELLQEHNVISGMGVVIMGPTGPYGALAVHSTHERTFSKDDVHFLQAIANVLGEGVRRQHAGEQLKRKAKQQATLASLGLFALEGHDLVTLMHHATTLVHETLQVDYSKILKLLPDGDTLLLKTGIGWRDGLVGEARVGTELDSQAGYTLSVNEPVIVADLRTESRFRGPALLREHAVVSGMSVIIRGPQGPYGVFGVHTKDPRTFSQDDVHFLQAVANVLGEAIRRDYTEAELQRAHDTLEERVEERTHALKNLTKELEAFNYTVSHDLRAPLRGIAGFSQVLLEDYREGLDEVARRYIARIQAGAARMGDLIDDLLTLSRVSQERMIPRQTDLSQIAQEVTERLQEREPQREVEFRITEGIAAHADPRLLTVVLENLMGNAWKFTRDQHPALIEFGTLTQDHETVYYVRDNGAGFNMMYAEKLFAPFQRLHRADEFEGTGIGLATVQRIVHLHGGNIWAEGKEGEGATFYFTLNPEMEDA